ncbi:3-hydroxy-3-methylglutaryl-coenzyme A reductase [Aphelenchoides bicaudatus]|nr:3-hydroxy-3-methylglutaryl-coenzyme A reductase [Aphelenchoides bicaudatus]
MSAEDLPHIINQLFLQSFPEAAKDKQRDFCAQLVSQVQKWKRGGQRTFSIGPEEEDIKDAEVQTDSNECSTNCQPSLSVKAATAVDDREILNDLFNGRLLHRNLEKRCGPLQAVNLRRKFLRQTEGYDYKDVNGACCENLIGYTPIPTGSVGPITVNGDRLYIPFATTEGALIASTNRGCKALVNGVTSIVSDDGMTRSPVLKTENITDATNFKNWIEMPKTFEEIKLHFEKTSRFCKLVKITPEIDGNYVYLRFKATTGDAMGMNMVSKACNAAMDYILKQEEFKGKIRLLSLSGNTCSDKKASASNWINGRGKSVSAEAIIPFEIVRRDLKCEPTELIELAHAKLQTGSSAAVCIGGSNAHAANIVAAIFLATGQDAAQVISSGMCSTHLELIDNRQLKITCTMKCLEVGTVGGGTILGPQHSNLKILRCAGSHNTPGENAKRLAQIICAAVVAGELSLLAAQCSGDLVQSHMKLNRSAIFLPNEVKCTESSETSTGSNFLDPLRSSRAAERLLTDWDSYLHKCALN